MVRRASPLDSWERVENYTGSMDAAAGGGGGGGRDRHSAMGVCIPQHPQGHAGRSALSLALCQ